LEFVLQILEIGALGTCIPKGSLEVANNNLSINAKIGIAGFRTGIQLDLGGIVEGWNAGCSGITVNVETFR